MKISLALLIVTMHATLSGARAVDYFWNNPGTGDWASGSNWTPAGPPGGGGGNFAYINNGGTASITASTNPIQDPIIASGPNTSGTVNHSAGTLDASAGWTFVARDPGGVAAPATGAYNMSGSSVLNTGQLQIGGRANAAAGSQAGATGTFTMSGSADVNLTGPFWLGSRGGTGTATISGGTLDATNIRVADNDGAVSGGSAQLNISGGTITSAGQFQVGRHGGVGAVNQTGGTVNVNGGWFGIANDNAGSAGSSYTLSGGSLNLNGVVSAEIGADTAGTMTVSGSGNVSANQFFVGFRTGGNGTLNMNGGTLTSRGGESRVGANAGATGTWNQTAGTVTMQSNLQIGASGTGTMNLSGGTVNNTGWLVVGRFVGGSGVLNASGGQILHTNVGNSMIVGENGTGTLNVSGSALVSINSPVGLRVGHTSTGNGTVNLDGGTLAVHFIQKTDAASVAKLNFNGGTLRALAGSADFFPGFNSSQIEIKVGGAVIDTNGFDIAVNQGLAGAGGVTKNGAGTLTLNGVSTYSGRTIINQGTLKLGAGASLNPSSVINVAAGAALDAAAAGGITVPFAQTLSGNGSLIGDVRVNGTASPGNSIGQLNIVGDLFLAGVTLMEIDRGAAPLNADLFTVTGDLDYGGTLNVVNLGAPLQYGDTFNLFDWGTISGGVSGAFASLNLPPLPAGLEWTNRLSIDGTLVVTPEPASAMINGLVLAAAGGLVTRRRRRR